MRGFTWRRGVGMEALGRKIARARGLLGLSQEALAVRAGLAGRTLGQIERGVSNPRVDTVRRVAGALGVDVRKLVGSGR